MKPTKSIIVLLNLAVLSAAANAATLVPITGLSSSHGGDVYANGMPSVNNGSGITKTDPVDPSTWIFDGEAYGDELMSNFLVGALNSKLAWNSFDFGATVAVDKMYLFNINYQGGIAGINQYNIYYAETPTVALPDTPAKNTYSITGLTPQGDYDFASGGWTKFNSSPLTATQNDTTIVDLTGVSARYIAIEILSNHGDNYEGGRVGLDEIAFTAISVPSALLRISSFSRVGGDVWELTLEASPSTLYEFRSSADLSFSPGTLIESLTQGNPGTDPGTISGANNEFITTDGGGNATVRVTITGTKNFIRAQNAGI